ncbi:hypothetical protein B0H16DRAFT_1599220 [Mycena metata]|uniref:Uncharacterized protein n=1 Tax=Mycena metata TaxID=1033252 RepID=A0AAD7MMN6_9AGAR|nr:hypothetical protein B0H16DRAFT_1599220 [Mycena metata]
MRSGIWRTRRRWRNSWTSIRGCFIWWIVRGSARVVSGFSSIPFIFTPRFPLHSTHHPLFRCLPYIHPFTAFISFPPLHTPALR